jgi:GT2 family glycosyltransferase
MGHLELNETRTERSGAQRAQLAVVIVSYQCRDLLDTCLCSVHDHAQPRARVAPEIWVVDNGSTDGTREMVLTRHTGVRFHAASANLGFAAANNHALRRTSADYSLVLNPDTVLHPGTVPRLIELMEQHPGIGIAGCRLVRPDGSFDHAARRSFPTIAGALGHFTGLGRGPRAPGPLTQYRAPDRVGAGPVDAVNGAFMLIRRKALEDVGLFDEGYWLYMEDLDLCYRLKQRGWIVWYEPSVSATHVKGATSGRYRGPRQNRAFHYGMYRFYRKFYAAERHFLTNLIVYAGIGGKLAVSLMRNRLARSFRGAQPTRRSSPDTTVSCSRRRGE